MRTMLHVGAGTEALPGWINIDNRPYPGIDRVLDVRDGLPFDDVQAIFAEHFIEHLLLEEARAFLVECRRALAPSGTLRLSTPNLDWVWVSHYRPPELLSPALALRGCLEMNRAFHGWGHKFLYNFATLRELLSACGFVDVVRTEFGESAVPELRALERHERSEQYDGLDPLLVIEASGRGPTAELPELFAPYLRDLRVT